ncbi:hypothetical protein LTR84_000947 [Exophiala bonariae]|uniref:Uncharacterized protein n=1 Tax=Exophiala bonariae TaxID=1690606 RepID=A0AAV9NSH2_9EURO|nr:hypothetical protein LTR84_000947 [Exophiala bonariae]
MVEFPDTEVNVGLDTTLHPEDLATKYGWPQANERGYRIQEQPYGTEKALRIIHIGAGISGICMAKFAPETLNNVSLVCYDKNSDIGGTWFENRYDQLQISEKTILTRRKFTWARNPKWSHFYSYAGEIWEYLRNVVEQFTLRKYMKLNHEVMAASWDELRGVWEVTVRDLQNDVTFTDTAEVLINNAGVLNNWKMPNIDGLSSFEGVICHTARYDTSLDLTGKRVAVIGTGSSGIQVTAEIADKVGQLYTWIRSPTWVTAGFAQNWAGPNGTNFECMSILPACDKWLSLESDSKEQKTKFEQDPLEYLHYCKQIESELNQRFKFILNGTPEAAQAKEFSTDQMKERLGGNEELINKIIPKAFNVGCRRPTPGNGFLEALTRDNVKAFVQGLQRITPSGFVNEDGVEHEVDVIICATGFDTSWIPRIPIIANGKNVQENLAQSLVSYLSIAVPEIPNYWMGVGPYGPLGHGSFIPIIELVTRHILTIVKKMQKENIKSMAPKRDISESFAEHADLFLQRTAWSGVCRSWFKQGRLDGKPAVFPGSRLVYMDLLKEPRFEDYEIVYQHGNPFGFLGNGFSIKEFDGSDLSYYLGTDDDPGALLPTRAYTNGAAKEIPHVNRDISINGST